MTRDELNLYLQSIAAAQRPAFFIERLFRTNEEWDRVSAHEFRNISFSPRTEASLDDLLKHRAVVILGEPGSGKSTVAKAATERAINAGRVPLVGTLRSYDGDLAALLRTEVPAELVDNSFVVGTGITRTFILDGLDEIPQELFQRFLHEFEALLRSDADARFVLTSRQAFYAAQSRRFKSTPDAFYLLGFRDRDVRAYVEHQGGNYDLFNVEVERVGLGHEISNPFALDVLHRAYREQGTLGPLRHQAVDHVVESLIASRPNIAAGRQLRALRMLAVAMETAARNELTIEEAIQLLRSATTLTQAEAEALLNELTYSILVRTTNGVAFQTRSYGEYLAAKELSSFPLDKIQALIWYKHTTIPNESWRNCVSYLAELHPIVRKHFTLRHPDWMLAVSPNAFSETQRTTVITGFLRRIQDERRYLIRIPGVSAAAAGRFVTSAVQARLLGEVADPEPVIAANALTLLGALQVASVVPQALQIATDRTKPILLRESAIYAVARSGDASLLRTLMGQLDETDPLHLDLVDCIGALSDATAIADVLPLLARTNAMVTSAFYRFRQLKSRDSAEALLRVLLAKPDLVQSRQFGSYAEPLWEAMAEHWDEAWATPLAHLLIEWEKRYVQKNDLEDVAEMLGRLPHRGEAVGRRVLEQLLATGTGHLHLGRTVASTITPGLAEWLGEQPDAMELKRTVAGFGSPQVRAALAPYVNGLIESQDAYADQVREDEQRQQERERRQIEEKRNAIRTDQRLGHVLASASELQTKDWPPLDDERRDWLAGQVQDGLRQIEPLTNVRWRGDNEVSYNPALAWLARITAYYGLQLADDVRLVQTLLAVEAQHVAVHYRKYGFTAAAVAEFERLLADPVTPNGALYSFLGFLGATEMTSAAIVQGLIHIASDVRRPLSTRSWAIRLASSKGATDAEMVGVATEHGGELADEAEGLLISRQYRPTIERRLAALIADPAEVDSPFDSPLSWIGNIRLPEVWPRLVELRAQSLRLAFPNVASLITETMKRIDGMRLVGVIREQIDLAPPEWREAQHIRSFEYERDARLQEAQATPFAEVIQRLRRATTLGLFKIWCEGLTDGPTLDELIRKLPGAHNCDIVTQSLGGWGNILSPNWTPDRLPDGCHDLVALVDGDKGRDWKRPGHPLTPEAERVRQRLAECGIELIVLERYAIENYFSQAACEAVLGRDPARLFPLPHYGPPGLNHNKNKNPAIARHIDLADLASTDLLRVLEAIVARSTI